MPDQETAKRSGKFIVLNAHYAQRKTPTRPRLSTIRAGALTSVGLSALPWW